MDTAHHKDSWVLEYPGQLEKNKNWSVGVVEWWKKIRTGVLEYWSNGVLGLKAEIDLIFTLSPLVMRDLNMVYIFPIYQPFINPLLHHSNTPGTINLLF